MAKAEKAPAGDVKTAILDAAERRMRNGGYGGFSFRELADDVGIKSSSVHYHFPTKEALAVAVVQRWSNHTVETVDRELKKDSDPVRAWTRAFRGTAFSEAPMCPCTVLGASSRDLPAPVADEVKRFFKMCISKMMDQGLTQAKATELLSALAGALLMASALRDSAEYDRATKHNVTAVARSRSKASTSGASAR